MKTNRHIRLVFYFILVPFEIICDETKFERELWKLTYEIVKKYFKHYRCVSYVTSNLENQKALRIDQPVINVDLTDDFSQFEVLVQTYQQGCGGYVIRTASWMKEELVKSLIDAYKNSTNFRYNNQRYLYLPYDEKDKDLNVLNMEEMYYLPNFLMVAAEKIHDWKLTLYSHNYFNGEKYDKIGVKYEIVDSYTNRKFEKNTDLYADKLENLYGKKVIVALAHFPLYLIVLKDTNNKTAFDGLEMRVSTTFVQVRNGTWHGANHPITNWGEFSPPTGIFGSVLNRGVDMGYSAIYQWFCDVLSCSYPYVYAGVTCMVPRPQMLPGWLTIVIPFTPLTWIYIISAYLASSCFVFFLSVGERRMMDKKGVNGGKKISWLIFDAFFNTLRLQMEQIPKEVYKPTPLAVYLRWLVVYYFFIANCWAGGIASILTVPRYEPPINKVLDLTSRYPTLKWGGNTDDWTISIRQSSEANIELIVNNFVTLDDETLWKRTKTRDFAFFVERLPKGHYGMNEYITEESLDYLKIMEHNIYTANVVTIMPKGSPYQERLDQFIFRMFETGLVLKMEVQVGLEKANSRLHNLIRTSNERPAEATTKLKIRHLEGPLRVYLVGMSFALIVFIIELVYNRAKLFKSDK